MKRRHNDPKPNYVLYGEHPARNVKLHVNAQLPGPMEIRPRQNIRFAYEAFRRFAALLQHTPDTVHVRIILDRAHKLVSTPTTGYDLVDQSWWDIRVKRFTFHATPGSTVRLEKRSEMIDQIHITQGIVRLYTEDGTCEATIEVPIILFLSSGSIILGEEGEF
jgi:hypothetical protein